MAHLIDTSVAIHLRDGDPAIFSRVADLPAQPFISVVTRVELEGGVHRSAAQSALLRPRLTLILGNLEEIPFTSIEAEIYGRIVAQIGYSRAKVLDRMIAATAIAAGATLITLNPRDFRNIGGLAIEDWTG